MNQYTRMTLLAIQMKEAAELLEKRAADKPTENPRYSPWNQDRDRASISQLMKQIRKQSILVDKEMYNK